MICPNCKKDIPDKEIAKHFASKGGKKSKRTITIEQQKAMQSARLGNKILTPKQLGQVLGISPYSVISSIKRGDLISEKIDGKYQIRAKEAVGWQMKCYSGDDRERLFLGVEMFRDIERQNNKTK